MHVYLTTGWRIQLVLRCASRCDTREERCRTIGAATSFTRSRGPRCQGHSGPNSGWCVYNPAVAPRCRLLGPAHPAAAWSMNELLYLAQLQHTRRKLRSSPLSSPQATHRLFRLCRCKATQRSAPHDWPKPAQPLHRRARRPRVAECSVGGKERLRRAGVQALTLLVLRVCLAGHIQHTAAPYRPAALAHLLHRGADLHACPGPAAGRHAAWSRPLIPFGHVPCKEGQLKSERCPQSVGAMQLEATVIWCAPSRDAAPSGLQCCDPHLHSSAVRPACCCVRA